MPKYEKSPFDSALTSINAVLLDLDSLTGIVDTVNARCGYQSMPEK